MTRKILAPSPKVDMGEGIADRRSYKERILRHWGDKQTIKAGASIQIARCVVDRPTPFMVVASSDVPTVKWFVSSGVYRAAIVNKLLITPPFVVYGEQVMVYAQLPIGNYAQAEVAVMMIPLLDVELAARDTGDPEV
jgi:hypothetical protein